MDDHAAFVEAYRHVRRDVERFACFLTRDRSLARDLLQDALATAWKRWAAIGSAERLKPYLTTAVIRSYHRAARISNRMPPAEHQDQLLTDTASLPDMAADVARLRDCIALLPDTVRIPLLLAEIEGWPLQDVADSLSLGLSAVKMRVKRGRDMLKAALTERTAATEEPEV